MSEGTFTTHDVAKFCGVYPSSVVNWIDGGRLKSYVTPGGHHRIMREDLLAFLTQFRIPIPSELSPSRARVLIVDDDVEVTRVLQRAFTHRAEALETEVCHDGVEALIRIGQAPPDLVVLDVVLPKMDGGLVCRVLKSKPATRGIKIVAITGKKIPTMEKQLDAVKVDALFRKPLDVIALVDKAVELVGSGAATLVDR